MDPIRISRHLADAVDALSFAPPVTHVYDPLVYARAVHEQYLERYARRGATAILLGMNPGPWGMSQTGVPFGEIDAVRNWLTLDGEIGKPPLEHPKRPIEGFACPRSEVSGRRLWSWARERFADPDAFFERFFVWNYCPLVFLEETGRNRTPDKLPAREKAPLFAACDEALRAIVEWVAPERVIGVGKFAATQAQRILTDESLRIDWILHPSPASPAANRGWAPQVEVQLAAMGLGETKPPARPSASRKRKA